jgi:hypothetical protein
MAFINYTSHLYFKPIPHLTYPSDPLPVVMEGGRRVERGASASLRHPYIKLVLFYVLDYRCRDKMGDGQAAGNPISDFRGTDIEPWLIQQFYAPG